MIVSYFPRNRKVVPILLPNPDSIYAIRVEIHWDAITMILSVAAQERMEIVYTLLIPELDLLFRLYDSAKRCSLVVKVSNMVDPENPYAPNFLPILSGVRVHSDTRTRQLTLLGDMTEEECMWFIHAVRPTDFQSFDLTLPKSVIQLLTTIPIRKLLFKMPESRTLNHTRYCEEITKAFLEWIAVVPFMYALSHLELVCSARHTDGAEEVFAALRTCAPACPRLSHIGCSMFDKFKERELDRWMTRCRTNEIRIMVMLIHAGGKEGKLLHRDVTKKVYKFIQ